tara:strand:- start:9378 stop:9875 length:498 start_codon:yes stop_codon:yes gene_type:complete
MQVNDVLIKKWCFGTGRAKVRQEAAVNHNGELQTYYTYPKYRTIVLKVTEAVKKGNQWHIKGERFSSLNGDPKVVKLVLDEKNGCYVAPNQKKPYIRVENPAQLTEEGVPPVGSLITVNKKHAIVTKVGRNELTVWVNNQLETVAFRPGKINWRSDKILQNAVQK